MRERLSQNLGGSDVGMARRIDAACRRFEADWREGREPRVEDYRGEVPEQARAALLAELEALARELRSTEDAELNSPTGAETPSTVAEAPTIPPRQTDVVPAASEPVSSVHDEPTRLPREDAAIDLTPYLSAVSGTDSPASIRYFGDYEIIREPARGGMGIVFEARQVSLIGHRGPVIPGAFHLRHPPAIHTDRACRNFGSSARRRSDSGLHAEHVHLPRDCASGKCR